MRLFTTVWPDAVASADVDARLAVAGLDGDTRLTAPERRHVTLCFHGEGFQGDADLDALAAALTAADLRPAAGLRLRCHGAGTFGTALWLGVEADGPAGLAALVAAAGGDPAGHVAHLTVARGPSVVPPDLPTGPGPWWTVEAVDLVASGTPYRTVARVAVPERTTGTLG